MFGPQCPEEGTAEQWTAHTHAHTHPPVGRVIQSKQIHTEGASSLGLFIWIRYSCTVNMNFLLVCVYCCGTWSSLLLYERQREMQNRRAERLKTQIGRGGGQQQVTGWRQASSSFKQHDGNITHVHMHTVIFFGQWCQTLSHSVHSPEKQENRSLSPSTAFLNIMKLSCWWRDYQSSVWRSGWTLNSISVSLTAFYNTDDMEVKPLGGCLFLSVWDQDKRNKKD